VKCKRREEELGETAAKPKPKTVAAKAPVKKAAKAKKSDAKILEEATGMSKADLSSLTSLGVSILPKSKKSPATLPSSLEFLQLGAERMSKGGCAARCNKRGTRFMSYKSGRCRCGNSSGSLLRRESKGGCVYEVHGVKSLTGRAKRAEKRSRRWRERAMKHKAGRAGRIKAIKQYRGKMKRLQKQMKEKDHKIKKLSKARECPTVNGLMRENARLKKKCGGKEELGEDGVKAFSRGDMSTSGVDNRDAKAEQEDYLSGLLGALDDGEEVMNEDLAAGTLPGS